MPAHTGCTTMEDNRFVVGVDIGGTNIRIGAVDALHQLHNPIKTPTLPFCGTDVSAKLLRFIQSYLHDLGEPVAAVTLGFPSTINKARTTVISTPNIPGLCNVNIKECFSNALNLPVFIEKDACMLAYCDLFQNGVSPDGVICGFYFGTGLGNVILIDGVPLVGKNGVACELGHVPTLDGAERCGCGLTGCLELYAAGRGLERLCAQTFPHSNLASIFVEHRDALELEGFVLAMAKAAATEINILNPDSIILGGGILAMDGFPVQCLMETIRRFTRKPLPADDLRFLLSDNSNPFNGVLGAALYTRTIPLLQAEG